MLGAIKHALANLANPNGRDGRSAFWYWMLAVFILRFAAEMVVTVPMTARIVALTVAMESGNEPYDGAAQAARLTQALMTEMPGIVRAGIVIGLAAMLLVATSLIRRLHDSGLSGWFVLVPGALYGAVLARSPMQMERAMEVMNNMDPTSPPSAAMMLQEQGPLALLAWVPLLLIIWIGLRRSEFGPNRYGDQPTQS